MLSLPSEQQHAVHRLYQYRKSISTKPFAARGMKLIRCPWCLLGELFCTCEHRQYLNTSANFMLIMYDDEVLKPTNSGRLIADTVPNTSAFLWSRIEPNKQMVEMINDPQYQPLLIFPAQYAQEGQLVVEHIDQVTHAVECDKLEINSDTTTNKKIPLLILLDGSWRQAIKMFRKSPYLHELPLLSFNPETLATYELRKGSHDFQLSTAEVAALAFSAINEPKNGEALSTWFDLFVESSLLGRNRRLKEDIVPIENYIDKFKQAMIKANEA
ncbi:DTW domain-containing protein [uncultured Shewanella sp.]|uniref:tRNA-uridine aminocarboxypropyltransferase n=1 Tax=uncultured Shewanella sp. TaxID=173975 RepID=UPI0026274EB8|nr:DTW domain-containing protein [uncultured Shewanella sp.]